MANFKYTLDNEGYPIKFGYGDFETSLTGAEPFTGFDIEFYRYDTVNSEWIYRPDDEEIDTTITEVKYDWAAEKVYIKIADQFRTGFYEFDSTENMTEDECQTLIDNYFAQENE